MRQVIAARRFAEASLTQARLRNQLTGELQYIGRLALKQFQLQLADRLRQLAGFYFAAIKRQFNAAFAVSNHPLFTREIGAEQRLHRRLQRLGRQPFGPDFRRKARECKLRGFQRDIIFRTLMQPAGRAASHFHGHLITAIIAANAQPHIVTAQLVVRGFVIDVEQLARVAVFGLKGVQRGAQRVNLFGVDDKFEFDFLSHVSALLVESH
ncbi:hypothetical protein BN132_1735 [Cronobacter turicensis 564]|nr:hypothetical protein BN132_1735 [Cronobacter turicensis 564]